MDNAEFTVLVQSSRRGKLRESNAKALQEIIKRKVFYFLVRKGQRPDSDLVDDMTNATFMGLYEKSDIPEKYSWQIWLHFIIRTAWANHCRNNFSEKNASLDDYAGKLELREQSVPVHVAANARMLENDGSAVLLQRADSKAPRDSKERELWKWATKMLVHNGKILATSMGALRSGLSDDRARQVIIEAVLCVRQIFEDVFGDYDSYSSEESQAARSLAEKVF